MRLVDGSTLVLEVKGHETEEDREKYTAATRWAEAVSNWGKLGQWRFDICRDPQQLGTRIEAVLEATATA